MHHIERKTREIDKTTMSNLLSRFFFLFEKFSCDSGGAIFNASGKRETWRVSIAHNFMVQPSKNKGTKFHRNQRNTLVISDLFNEKGLLMRINLYRLFTFISFITGLNARARVGTRSGIARAESRVAALDRAPQSRNNLIYHCALHYGR